MRDLKFRAFSSNWDSFGKETAMEYFKLGELHGGYTPQLDIGVDEEATTIMQYTGLKDKNGKEIYEGDIVRYTAAITEGDQYREEEIIAPIEFECGAFMANPKDSNYDTDFTTYPSKLVEVIGNIWENPELKENK